MSCKAMDVDQEGIDLPANAYEHAKNKSDSLNRIQSE